MPWADLSDVRLFFEVQGHGQPLVLVPGLGTTSELWQPVRSDLEQHFTLILIDNRGLGQSQAKRPARNLSAFSSDILELLDYLQLDQVHMLGLSLGGIVTQRFAVDHPDRLNRLVLMSCTHRFGPYLKQMANLIGHALKHLPPDLFVWTMELLGSSPRAFDANPVADVQRIAEISQSHQGMLQQLAALSASDAVCEDYLIQSPTLVIAGEHDTIIPSCYARSMADAIPGSTFWLVPEAGHVPIMELPQRVLPGIIAFLEGQDLHHAAAILPQASRQRAPCVIDPPRTAGIRPVT